MKFRFEIPVNESREKVWKAMDNVENMKTWQPTLKSFEHQSGEPGQVGAVSKLTYDENGREIVLTETITGRKEPEEFSGTYDTQMARNSVKNTFVELGDNRTKWVLESEFRFKGFFFKLLSPFIRGSIKKRLRTDMSRFKTLIEKGQLS